MSEKTSSTIERKSRPTAVKRRVAASLNVAAYTAVLLVVVALVNILAQARPLEMDLTAGRRHSLSPRTLQILRNLEQQVELALVLERGALTGTQAEDFLSILEAYDRAGGENVRVTRIGAADASDLAEFAALTERLKSVYEDEVREIRRVLDIAMRAAEEQLATLRTGEARIASALAELVEQSTSSQTIAQYLPLVSNYAQGLEQALDRARFEIESTEGAVPVPDYDAARAILAAGMEQPARLASHFADHFEILAGNAATPAGARTRFRTLTQVYRALADELSVARETLLRPQPLELSEIARSMQAASYLLILSARHATAVPLSTLFPADPAGGTSFAGEGVISVVMASLTLTEPPLVYFLHAEPQSLFGPGSRLIGAAQRLAGQRLRLAEWSVALSPEPPQVPFPDAPVVYIALPTSDATTDGMQRQANLAATVAELIAQGESILYHLQPSTLAAAGQDDVSLTPLRPLGISAATDLKLLTRVAVDGEQRVNQPEIAITRYPGEHLIAAALADLPSRFYEVTPVRLEDAPTGVQHDTLITVGSRGGQIWAESDWTGGRWQEARPGGPRDETTGPWTLAVAVERDLPPLPKPQRLVIIGAAGAWLTDDVTQQVRDRALANPGNNELLEASVYWLAGLDELVAPGGGAIEVARLRSDAPTRFVGYLLILVLPVVTLLAGIAVGMIRRHSISRGD